MTKSICGICHEDIYLYYYKSNKCKCNVRYHLSCIIDWYKINNVCIYCKNIDNTDVNKIRNKFYEIFILLISIIIIILYYYIIYI